jgi:7-cyano-7-deazaguanine reductase
MTDKNLTDLALGKVSSYSEHYDPSLLQGVPRSMSRNAIELPDELPFSGVDIWNAYELSWLNTKGKPQVAIMRCEVPITSPNLIESKSFKLYLNSFNQSKYSSSDDVLKTIQQDLSECAGASVRCSLILANDFKHQSIGDLDGIVLDDLDISIDNYDLSADKLIIHDKAVEECLVSHLLKSNCLITNQPDWGSVLIKYAGAQIDHESVLKYLISFRQHNEFHEQCVERIFYDIQRVCKPTKLTVYARYTRRGGLDINPFRSNFEAPYEDCRLARQ